MKRSYDEAPVSVMGSRDESLQRQAGFSGQLDSAVRISSNMTGQHTGLYMLPLEYTFSSDEPEASLLPILS